MILQDFDVNFGLSPLVAVIVMIFLLVLHILVYTKWRVWYFSVVLEVFSLVIGVSALNVADFPMTPYFQIFFLIFNVVIFILISVELYKAK